jgi:hypothetical protein
MMKRLFDDGAAYCCAAVTTLVVFVQPGMGAAAQFIVFQKIQYDSQNDSPG